MNNLILRIKVKNLKNLTILMIFLLIWLQYSMWFGKNGIYSYSVVSNSIKVQQMINSNLKSRNNQIISEINDLNNNQEAIEEQARNRLSMIKTGESFYRLIPKNSKTSKLNEKFILEK